MRVRRLSYKIGWLFKMAWRDSRRNHSRLILFGSSVVLGVAALVAVYSLEDNLRKNVDTQAAALLGADLVISGNRPADDTIAKMMDSITRERSHQRSFASMIYFPKTNGSRLVDVRALHGPFPY